MSMDNDQDLKPLFQRVEPLGAALQERVMNQIREKHLKRERFFVKNKVSILLITGMLLTASTGFAAVKYHSLTNGKGEVVYEEKSNAESPSRKDYSKEELNRIHLMNTIWDEQIKPGEAAIIYVVPDNPKHAIDIKSTPHAVKDFAKLQSMVNVPGLPLAKELSGSGTYTFNNASVHMERETDVNPLTEQEKADIAKKLLEKAKASGKDYALMPVKFTDQFWLSTVYYASGNKKVSLTILNNGDHGSVTSYWDESTGMTSRKIEINGQDVLQKTWNGGNSAQLAQLDWVYEEPTTGHHYMFSLNATTGDIAAEELIRIAKTIIPKADSK
ncbi:hypothetical protein PAEVO_50420 [Paenibacillus sp. GM2FR]|uniref:DUF4367 domain-containing protein n=1 Tax=Paenibacillus TaxID=44249 RepID=UPI000C275859|nr:MULTISPECIES: DUF4367 domain-containing protein [Paenibacillus]MEC0254688.1 DUF4367 domain-containing protein [Paenibacillus lautus]MEC0309863.1 DUF4367 domain-containing protein [Paenibacillus lautus]PJN51949.1 hypothetical protein PAEVO_50420 [Paenibacillus sp. GM2FR]